MKYRSSVHPLYPYLFFEEASHCPISRRCCISHVRATWYYDFTVLAIPCLQVMATLHFQSLKGLEAN